MRNADQLDERWPGPIRERGRIRYAFGGVPPRGGPARVGPPAAEPPAATPHTDLWVLICGGIAAVAAFAAAFAASGGISHAATPPAPVHSVSIQACPTAAPGR
jgi:hypothetical protein